MVTRTKSGLSPSHPLAPPPSPPPPDPDPDAGEGEGKYSPALTPASCLRGSLPPLTPPPLLQPSSPPPRRWRGGCGRERRIRSIKIIFIIKSLWLRFGLPEDRVCFYLNLRFFLGCQRTATILNNKNNGQARTRLGLGSDVRRFHTGSHVARRTAELSPVSS